MKKINITYSFSSIRQMVSILVFFVLLTPFLQGQCPGGLSTNILWGDPIITSTANAQMLSYCGITGGSHIGNGGTGSVTLTFPSSTSYIEIDFNALTAVGGVHEYLEIMINGAFYNLNGAGVTVTTGFPGCTSSGTATVTTAGSPGYAGVGGVIIADSDDVSGTIAIDFPDDCGVNTITITNVYSGGVAAGSVIQVRYCTDVATGADCVSVPVELTSFTAEHINNANHIYWETASELENDYFLIERSVDGKVFQGLKKIDGAGTTIEKQQYRFIDKTPPALSYYRLKQVNLDGTFEYSNLISVVSSKKESLVEVFPVPTKDELTIQYPLSTSRTATFTLINTLGYIMDRGILLGHEGVNYHTIDLSKQAAGTYFMLYQDGSTEEKYRIVKQ